MKTKLTTAELNALKIRAFSAAEDGELTYLMEELHNEAVNGAENVVQDHCDIPFDDLPDDQREALIMAWKDGFWEPTHKEERDNLKAEVQRLRDALESIRGVRANSNSEPDAMGEALEKCVAVASETLGTSGADRFPGLFVMKVPTMSTCHITKEDGALLCAAGRVEVLAEISGGYGHIVDFPDADTIEEDFAEFSPAFRHILTELAKAGYTYVRFDADHMPCPAFPSFEW